MQYKKFKDINISRLGMGNMRLPERDGHIDVETARAIIDRAVEGGVNYFDTAWMYHSFESQKFLGETMKKYPRDSFYLATKFHNGFQIDHKTMFEEQLKQLQTDYVDFYLLHGVGDTSGPRYIDEGAVDYFLEQQQKGRIRYLGFSAHASTEYLAKFASHHKWDFAQIQLNYFDWLFKTAAEEYKILEERDIPIVVMEPVRGGRLASLTPEADAPLREAHPEWSIASWAFRFVRSLPQVQVVLSGMSSMDQINDNLLTFSDDTLFTDKDREILFEAARKFEGQVQVPCTSCRYCCDGCPSQINIPEWLALYNRYKLEGEWIIKCFAPEIKSEGKPEQCIQCGACSGMCPQSIDIPSFMTGLAEKM